MEESVLSKSSDSNLRNLKVSDLLSEIISVLPQDSAAKVRKIFRDFKPRTVAVVDNSNKLLGVIYRSSIVALTSRKTHAEAKDIMEFPRYVASLSDNLIETIKNMIYYDEWNVMVIDNNNLLKGGLLLESFIEKGLKYYREKLESIKISEFMSKDVMTVSPEDFIINVINSMIERRYSGLPVVDEKNRLVGIITQYDIISKGFTRVELESESGPKKGAKVKKAMTRTVFYLYPWSPLTEAMEAMIERGYGRIPVVNDPRERKLVGIIDREDVAKAILYVIGEVR
jgi:CBS domain-containing protein